jgi:hypothetical protein
MPNTNECSLLNMARAMPLRITNRKKSNKKNITECISEDPVSATKKLKKIG